MNAADKNKQGNTYSGNAAYTILCFMVYCILKAMHLNYCEKNTVNI